MLLHGIPPTYLASEVKHQLDTQEMSRFQSDFCSQSSAIRPLIEKWPVLHLSVDSSLVDYPKDNSRGYVRFHVYNERIDEAILNDVQTYAYKTYSFLHFCFVHFLGSKPSHDWNMAPFPWEGEQNSSTLSDSQPGKSRKRKRQQDDEEVVGLDGHGNDTAHIDINNTMMGITFKMQKRRFSEAEAQKDEPNRNSAAERERFDCSEVSNKIEAR